MRARHRELVRRLSSPQFVSVLCAPLQVEIAIDVMGERPRYYGWWLLVSSDEPPERRPHGAAPEERRTIIAARQAARDAFEGKFGRVCWSSAVH